MEILHLKLTSRRGIIGFATRVSVNTCFHTVPRPPHPGGNSKVSSVHEKLVGCAPGSSCVTNITRHIPSHVLAGGLFLQPWKHFLILTRGSRVIWANSEYGNFHYSRTDMRVGSEFLLHSIECMYHNTHPATIFPASRLVLANIG